MKRLKLLVLVLFGALSSANAAAANDVTEAHLTAIDVMMEQAFEPTAPGAAIVIVKDGNTVLKNGYGLADLELGVPVRPETVFRIGSITKTFTALAILLLEERGLLSLDDAIGVHLPDTPRLFRNVTIEQLMSHTGGVPDLFDDAYYDFLSTRAHDLLNNEVDAEEFLSLLDGRELDFTPGTSFRYSNGGYFLLGKIIESVSGMTYPEFITTAITEPLMMHRTVYFDPIGIVPGRVRAYLDDEGGYINNPYAFLSGSCTYASSGFESSVNDLVRFAQALQSSDLFPADLTSRIFESRTVGLLPASQQYGLGSWIGKLKHRPMVWHGGDVYGFSSTMVSFPDDRIFVVILSNNPYVTSRDLDLLARQAAAVLMDDPFPQRVQIDLNAGQMIDFPGIYQVTGGVVREVSVDEGRLYIQRDGGRKIEAIPATPTRFFFNHTLSYVTFERDERDRITRLILHRDSGEREIAVKRR